MGNQSSSFSEVLKNPLFKSDASGSKISTVEKWYTSDPTVSNSYAMKGDRPLIAINLDEYFKYITVTNPNIADSTTTAKYWARLNDSGERTYEQSDTYFYALQGDRVLYRQQFLTNRLEYIDSWLTLGNYARGGSNRIRSRISANSASTSDKWIKGEATNGNSELLTGQEYWLDNDGSDNGTKKAHEFDAEYWVDMTPIRNAYVTAGSDTANYPSKKYTGSPVRLEFTDLKTGFIYSGNFREQLCYIYGLNQMKSLGDMSKLYFQEFEIFGSATKMTDLLLGYDGVEIDIVDGKEVTYTYSNNDVNNWTIPASASGKGMPLLKEVNLSNVRFKNADTYTLDFSSCEKLENFRDTGSNLQQAIFADGVALNTLHLTSETKVLTLTEARMLTDLVRQYRYPTKDSITGKLVVADDNKGLYIANLTDKNNNTATTNLTQLEINGGGLGYNSYELLDRYYHAAKNTNEKINR
jgi:hypothetical protein